MTLNFRSKSFFVAFMYVLTSSTFLISCASNIPFRPKADVVPAALPEKKYQTIHGEKQAPVVYVKLEDDILRPIKKSSGGELPNHVVGPFELREETLAAALELVMGTHKVPMSFETGQAMTRTVTMTSLQGPLNQVVDKLCSLANLYCSYENDSLVIKDVETFSVSLPPFIAEDYEPFVNGLRSITGGQTYVDSLTRTLVYTTTHRNHQRAKEYFDRLRANTAMIVYEMQIWEVALNDNNQLGINWNDFTIEAGRLTFGLANAGTSAITGAVGIGTQLSGSNLSVDAVLNFLRTQGAVKTISQPQLTVLSGSNAKLRVGNSRDYVSQITRTVGISTMDNVSVTTSKLETGLNLEISSAWDNSTVYGDLKIELQNLIRLGSLEVGTTSIQLPETSDRSIETKLRVRPGDAVIIGGIVEERDELSQEGPPGPGNKPVFLTNRTKAANNSELVFMLRPRVVVYTENLPQQANLMPGGITSEAARLPIAPAVLPQSQILEPTPLSNDALEPTPLAPAALSEYMEQLPVDEIAPAP